MSKLEVREIGPISGETEVRLAEGATAVGFSGNSNIIINGGFDVWQRGTSFTSTSPNEYSADRWRTEGHGHNTTISQQSFTFGQTDVPNYPTYFCRIESSSTVASGQYWAFQQRVERPQFISGSDTYTLSFWVKSTAPVPAGAFNFGIPHPSNLESSPALTTSWQKVTTTRTIASSASSVSIYIVYFGEGQGNITVDIADVQLEIGNVATPFEREFFGNTVAKCQRYYCKSYNLDIAPQTNNSLGRHYFYLSPNLTSGNKGAMVSFPVTMKSTPTITIYEQASGISGQFFGGIPAIVTVAGQRSFMAYGETTGKDFYAHWTADAEL